MNRESRSPGARHRPVIERIAPYEPGKPIKEVQREYGLDRVVKLASNENPLGPSPRAMAAVQAALGDLHRYPDGSGFALRDKLARRFGLELDNVVLGNGSAELVELVTEAFVGDGEEVVIPREAFFKYRIAVQIMNGVINWAPMPDLQYDPDAVLAAVTPHTKAVFIANPNNPTGTLMDRGAVEHFMERLPDTVLAVFDEAYYDYRNPDIYPDTLRYVGEGRSIVVLRTFSKSYGLAGLRVGYALAPARIAWAMNAVREVFNVNLLGQVAAAAALDDLEFLQRGVRLNLEGRKFFYERLDKLGLDYVPSEANFVLIRTPVPGRELFQWLLRRGVVVRPVDGYGLTHYVRVSVGLPEENALFFDCLGQFLSDQKSGA